MCVEGAQKNHLIETVLFSTQNICFGWEIRKLFSNSTLIIFCTYNEVWIPRFPKYLVRNAVIIAWSNIVHPDQPDLPGYTVFMSLKISDVSMHNLNQKYSSG